MAPPFLRLGPADPACPILLSVPHAGRDYGSGLLAEARVERALLETLEDRLADRLVWRAAAAGATAFIACAPRAVIDLNRDEREIDPTLIAPALSPGEALPSTRSRGGLGLIPSRLAGAGAIWKRRIPRAEFDRRIERVHRPYHEALRGALARARARFGAALLLDCHSMPPRSAGPESPEIVFGDLHGTRCGADLVAVAEKAAAGLGFRVARNAPFAGGHIIARHGDPAAGIHALQIEIDRSAYLDEALREPGPGFDRVARLIEQVTLALAERLGAGAAEAIAAE